MKGDERIAEILTKDYGIKDLTPYEEINYEISNFTDEISRVEITSKTGRRFFCPVYAMFDGYHMAWYGDYGSFVFDCTWKTNVMNLAYRSPYYQLEKLNGRKRYSFDSVTCEKQFLKLIKEGDFYKYDLTEEQRKRFDEYISESSDFISYDDILCEHEEICTVIKTLYRATGDEYEWIAELRNNDLDEDDFYNIFGCADYEIYCIGDKAPLQYFIILYMLSVVANLEAEKQKNEVTENE